MSVNIEKLNKVLLLKALWENSKPASFFSFSGVAPPQFDQTSANDAVNSYIDYFQGRMIKSDLSRDTADPRLYDRDYGQGVFQRIADKVRSSNA
jgi:hypothetical protein